MGKLRRSYRKALAHLKFAVAAIVAIAVGIQLVATSFLGKFLWLIPASAIFFFKLLQRLFFTPKKYINDQGYVVLSESNEL